MPSAVYIDIFSAKEKVSRILREMGAQPYSRLLMNSQLPQDVLDKALDLLSKEHKVRSIPSSAETTFQSVSSVWPSW